MKRSRGKMSKRSRLLRKRVSKPKLGITKLVKTFNEGDKVHISIKSGHFEGMPHPKYRGKLGIVVGARGKSYVVEIMDYAKKKQLILPAVHLEKA